MSKKRTKKKHEVTGSVRNTVPYTRSSDPILRRTRWENALIVFVLTAVTVIVYRGVLSSDFAYYDDESYITVNENIHSGITWQGIKWAFTAVGYSDNWHPLTWLSHMLDVQVFGLNPGGHHFTNLVLHVAATLLLFAFLSYSTGERRLSAIIAALFAWHPLHVESVAWISERKDVLSAVFGFAALWAYSWYVRAPTVKKFGAVLLLFACGLLSKPMLVTLPFVMLLLDFWPLNRLVYPKYNVLHLVVEKLPLLALVVVSVVMTVLAQQGAMRSLAVYDLSTRLSNAIISYCVYIGQLFWPGHLAVLYPFPCPEPLTGFLCAVALAAISLVVLLICRRKRYALSGWLWYLGTLVPVIGIMQVGSQAHADRYTYIPYVGLFMIIVWGLNDVMTILPARKKTAVASFLLVAVFSVMILKTNDQVGYWKDGVTLLSHAIAVTRNNEIAHYNLGNLMQQAGRNNDAVAHYTEALRINPGKLNALGNLAGVYFQMRQYDKAKEIIEKALALAQAAGDTLQIRDIQDNIALLNQMIGSDQHDSLAATE